MSNVSDLSAAQPTDWQKSLLISPLSCLIPGLVLIIVVVGVLALDDVFTNTRMVLSVVAGLSILISVMSGFIIWQLQRNWRQAQLAKMNLKRNFERLELMQEVSQYHAENVQDLLDFSLGKVIALTESRIGYIYHYSEEQQQFVLNSWSKGVMEACSVAEPQSVYQLDKTGLWGEVIRQRRAIMFNDFAAPDVLKKGYPAGHVVLSRFLSIPLFDNERIVAVVGVANKFEPYDQSDLLQLTLMMDGVWKIATRLKLEEQVTKLNDLFNLFMKYSPVYTFIKEVSATDSRVLQASDNFIDLVGMPPAEMIGKTMHQLFPAEFADQISADDRRVVDAGEIIKIEEELQGKHFLTYKFPIQSADGRRLLAGYTIDISDLKRTERELRKTGDYLEKLISYANAPIIVWDTRRNIIRFNHAFERLTGYHSAEVLSKSLDILFPQESREQCMNEFARTADGKMMESVEIPILCRDGGKRLVLWNSANIYDTDAVTLVSTIAQGIDITERRQAEESLREIQCQLLQNDKLATIGQLAAGVAHEINNPICFVSSNLDSLGKYLEKYNHYISSLEQELCHAQGGVLSDEIQKVRRSLKIDFVMRDISDLVVESIDGVERVKSIVKDLKIFSRADTLVGTLADLNACLDSTINIVTNEIKYVAELKREYGELPKVSCNIQQINQVFINLLINAAHAIQATGETRGEILVRTWCSSEWVFVSISDSGCGIPPEIRGKIFDAFYTTKEIGKGTGLGLSISAEIIRKHGGQLSVVSDVGVGSTFTIQLPRTSLQQTDKEQP